MPDAPPSRASPAAAVPRGWRSLLTGGWHRSSWVVALLMLLFLVFCNVPGQMMVVKSGGIGPNWTIYLRQQFEHGWPLGWAERELSWAVFDGSAYSGFNCWNFWETSPRYRWPSLALNVLLVSSLSLVCGTLFESWRRARSRLWQLHMRDILGIVFIVSLVGGWYVHHRGRHARQQQVIEGASVMVYAGAHESSDSHRGIVAYQIAPGGPTWLRLIAGDEPLRILDRVVSVKVDSDGLAWAPELPDVRALYVRGDVNSTKLSHLERLPRLELLDLSGIPHELPDYGTLGSYLPAYANVAPPSQTGLVLPLLPQLRCLLIGGKPCEGFDNVPSLESLYWLGPPADEKLLLELTILKQLRELKMVDCTVAWHRFHLLSSLPNLQRLELTQTTIADDHLRHVGTLAELRELTVSDCPLLGRGLKHLAGLTKLESLDLSWTNVDDGAIEHLLMLKNLRRLDLSATRVSANAIPHLAQMNQLQSLSVPTGGFTAAEQKQLRAELPGSEIVFRN